MSPKTYTFYVVLFANLHYSLQCPDHMQDAKAAYKSGEIIEQQAPPVTLQAVRSKLQERGIFDYTDPSLTDRDRKQLSKLFDAIQIMISSRARQPYNLQPNMFSSLRIVERAVKKQLKEGQISETLAAKFNWDKLAIRLRRSKPRFSYNKATKMRTFHIDS